MALAQVSTGTSSILFLEGYEVATDPIANTRTITWSLYLRENGGSNAAWNAGGISAFVDASVNGVYQGNLWAGSFGFDFRPGGYQTQVIATGNVVFGANPDGSGSVEIAGHIGYTGSPTAGGPTDVGLSIPVTTMRRVPGTPSGITVSRVSDNATRVRWNNNGPSNGQATRNQLQASTPNANPDGILEINASNQADVAILPNEKKVYRVRAGNDAGWSPWSGWVGPIYTTPGAPSNVTAVKQANLDIVVNFSENVSYPEYNHEIEHGTVAGGITTWDGTLLTTLAADVLSYTHTAPDASKVHVYRVRAKQGALLSPYVLSNTVQLLVAPNKPTMVALPQFIDQTQDVVINWMHNPIDTSPQSAVEWRISTDGGATWGLSGKVLTTVQSRMIVSAGTYPPNTTIQTQVRTWGQATTGGMDGTGSSPWSDSVITTIKNKPTTSITTPTNGSILNDATLRATLGFSQAQGASFVRAELNLLQGATLLEQLNSNNRVGITFVTPVQNGVSYTVRARVQDSNGIWSNWASSNFSVAYLSPVPATLRVSYLPDNGYGQLDLTIPAPGTDQSVVSRVTITRTIDAKTEDLVLDYPASSALTFLDTTPTIHGSNVYTITTKSALGAQSTTIATLVTTECRRAYLSKGAGFNNVVVFGANLEVSESLGVASDTVQAAGRPKPIGLYGVETNVQLKVKSFIFEREGFSTIDQLRAILLVPGKACYRDSSGRRVFGSVKGSVAYKKTDRGDLTFTLTETS